MEFIQKTTELAKTAIIAVAEKIKPTDREFNSIEDMIMNDSEIADEILKKHGSDCEFIFYIRVNEEEFVEHVNKYGIKMALANMRVKMSVGDTFTPKPISNPNIQDGVGSIPDYKIQNNETNEEFSFKANFDLKKFKGAFEFNWKKNTKKN